MGDERIAHLTIVQIQTIEKQDSEIRLDRWFRDRYPHLGQGAIEKLLRTGQIRVDGRRVKANFRLEAGQKVRVPPIASPARYEQAKEIKLNRKAADELGHTLASSVLHLDEEIIVIDKPAGLAVQGGTSINQHIDGVLDTLTFGNPQKPKLVHRLDKDTSGVLVLARDRKAAQWLTKYFREQAIEKTYWALVVGELRPVKGKIDSPLKKTIRENNEKMRINTKDGQTAITHYAIVEQLGRTASWVAMRPKTGRTHQLRVHMASLGTPIHGDGKYGGRTAFLDLQGISKKIHLHARDIRIRCPNGKELFVTADLPNHMKSSWSQLGLDTKNYKDPFGEWL